MIAGCRTLSRTVWLTACSAALLAGCGGERPKLAGADAAPLVALAHRVPRDAPCAQARDIRTLQRRATALVNARRVPVELQEPLMSGVAALAEQAPVCLPKVPASAPTPPASPSSPSPPASGGKRSTARKHGHDHRHGKGKRKK